MKVYYTPKMLGSAQVVSPSLCKPAAVAASWRQITPDPEVIELGPVTGSQVCLAHHQLPTS